MQRGSWTYQDVEEFGSTLCVWPDLRSFFPSCPGPGHRLCWVFPTTLATSVPLWALVSSPLKWAQSYCTCGFSGLSPREIDTGLKDLFMSDLICMRHDLMCLLFCLLNEDYFPQVPSCMMGFWAPAWHCNKNTNHCHGGRLLHAWNRMWHSPLFVLYFSKFVCSIFLVFKKLMLKMYII